MIQSAFLSTLQAAKLPGRQWRLLAPLRYQSAVLGALIEVPTGALTDFASVPRLPLAYLLAGDTAHEAAVLHDWSYQVHPCTRVQADAVFYEAMAVTGEPRWRRRLMWSAVRTGGWWAWRTGPRRYSRLLNYHIQDRRVEPREPPGADAPDLSLGRSADLDG